MVPDTVRLKWGGICAGMCQDLGRAVIDARKILRALSNGALIVWVFHNFREFEQKAKAALFF